ncbi:xylulokinase [Paenibacillus glycanilyticus]|uniref:Xylulose kinase n=1 Tax=Paenibacillus glycanilyticus TaxID=126569 RepID=A0ABQ6NHM1_9BACL|nr:xylulokinase [Paenibacillus glycanilyticus]GMK44065.1 xylulokinase [Paenibacillus glycanilyticus]
MSVLLGIDIGTSSVKSLLMDAEGNVIGFSQLEYDISIPSVGRAEQDPEVWWDLVCRATTLALGQANIEADNITGIGLSGQMHGLVALDRHHNVIRPAIIWCDQRSSGQTEELNRLFSQEELGGLIQNPVAAGFQLPSLMWLKEHEPDSYRKIAHAMLPKDYIRFRLTGRIGVDTTDASGTSAYNVAGKSWAISLLNRAGIDASIFPAAGEPWEIAGQVSPLAAATSPFKQGTPVVYGGADQAMQAIGNGILAPGIVSCTIGTGGQLFAPIDTPVYDASLRTHTYVHAAPGKWYLLGASMSAGLSLRWLAGKVLGRNDYGQLDLEAAKVAAGSEGLLFLPYLAGDRTPHMDAYAKGMFFGLTLNHGYEHMVRSVLEGVGYSMRDSLEIFKKLGVRMDRIIVSGGGAQSRLWKQIMADVLGSEVYTSTMKEQACVGAAIMAGVGTGTYADVEQAIAAIVRIQEEPIRPLSENEDVYARQYEVYKQLYASNKALFPMLGRHD